MEAEASTIGRQLEKTSAPLDFDPATIRDITGERSVGYSFAFDAHNKAVSDRLNTMLGRLAPDIFVRDEEGTFIHGGARWRLDEGRANSVMRKEQRFLRSLFAAIFFDAGPANRGTELASTIIKNTAEQTRDVVIGPGGAVIFDTAHSKSAWKGIYVDKVSLRVFLPILK
ncbi:hypothetical protein CF319_g8469 [Tilletia indica]|nr:hypothetical protein CF319_g8469 [Tilletia indica]